MDFPRSKQLLLANSKRIQSLVEGLSLKEARWKPATDSWSILEVVNHLLDEEREDFRVRLDIILHDSKRPWPAIDPEGWIESREYNARDLEVSVASFMNERRASLEWLDTLIEPDWEATYEAPFGSIRAGDMFASWVAHDLLHMRQIVELHRSLALREIVPYQSTYAGPW